MPSHKPELPTAEPQTQRPELLLIGAVLVSVGVLSLVPSLLSLPIELIRLPLLGVISCVCGIMLWTLSSTKSQPQANTTTCIHIVDAKNVTGVDKEQSELDGMLKLITLFQKQGRLVDFLMDDLAKYTDPQISHAARFVHTHCRKVLQEDLNIQSVYPGSEGQPIELPPNYDLHAYKLEGLRTHAGPVKGLLSHRGWQMAHTTDGIQRKRIIQPARIEPK